MQRHAPGRCVTVILDPPTGRPDVNSDVDVMFPRRYSTQLDSVIDAVTAARRLQPYSPILLEFCSEFARNLGRRARGMPELQALAFWMRRAELVRLREQFHLQYGADVLLVPRGVVFHVPPANVDTIFVYSWLLSLLAGNANVVRLSSRGSAQTDIILEVLAELATQERYDEVARTTFMVRYGHHDAMNAALSRIADLRVIWGGDATVAAFRRFAIAPHATDLTFPDRVSLSVVNSQAYEAMDDAAKRTLAERFFNDSYWFDQMGCSSPRVVVWTGGEATTRRAAARFFGLLEVTVAQKGYHADTATAIAKLTFASRAVLDQPVESIQWFNNEIAVLPIHQFPRFAHDYSGAGTFYQFRCDRLTDLAAYVTRRHQTLTYAGFSAPQMREFAMMINGRGIDRVVPVGDALNFNRFWDGNDLVRAFVRTVHIGGQDPLGDGR